MNTFKFGDETIPYLDHPHNNTAINERRVEIPIALSFLAGMIKVDPEVTILEVGNVLRNYDRTLKMQVIDKYEKAKGVVNIDVQDLPPDMGPFNVIMSVSTLEHIGTDDPPHIPARAKLAIDRLYGLLAPGGCLFFTIPVGYNADLDERLFGGELVEHLFALKRISKDNRWEQVNPKEVRKVKYGEPYNNGNAILIGLSGRNPNA